MRDRRGMVDESEGGILIEEIGKALRKVKSAKSTGLDGISGEMLLEGDVSVVEWMLRLFNLCLTTGVVPQY